MVTQTKQERRNIMNIITWDPFREMESLLDRYNRSPARASSGQAGWSPVVDIQEDKHQFLIKAELPGVDKDDVKVMVEDRVLTLSGEKKAEVVAEDGKQHRNECFYGSFSRSFSLPNDIDAEAIAAEYKHGILNLRIPKSEKVKPKEIAVTVS
jgi:HSP20 family protein